jgi:hypothetical protein
MYVITTIIVICIILLVLHGFYLSYLESLKEDVSSRQLSNDGKLCAASTRKCIGEYKNL